MQGKTNECIEVTGWCFETREIKIAILEIHSFAVMYESWWLQRWGSILSKEKNIIRCRRRILFEFFQISIIIYSDI